MGFQIFVITGIFIAMLVTGIDPTFFILGLGSGYAMNRLVAWHTKLQRRKIAKACYALCFVYQAELGLRLVQEHLQTGEVNPRQAWKQRFWARSMMRYAKVAEGIPPFSVQPAKKKL